jgi:hypothetical protein
VDTGEEQAEVLMERDEMKRLYLVHREVEEARDVDAVVSERPVRRRQTRSKESFERRNLSTMTSSQRP